LIAENEIMQCGTAVSAFYMAIDIQPIEPKQNQEAAIREAADDALSARLDVLEQDTTSATALAQETAARIAADGSQDTRLDTLETADVTINSRLDTLEADTSAQALADAALVEAKAYTDQQMAGIPDIDYSIDYGEYA